MLVVVRFDRHSKPPSLHGSTVSIDRSRGRVFGLFASPLAMLAKHGTPSPSSLRVLCLLSTLTIVIANNAGEKLAKDASTTTVGDETKAEASGTKGETLLGVEEPSTRSNRGPFVRGRDSYLEALRHSRISTDPREGVVDVADGAASFQRRKEQSFAAKRSELSLQTSSDSYSMVPSDSYSLPTRPYSDFSGLRNSYGPPRQTQPPRGTYGPPHNDHSPYGGEYASVGVYSQPQPGETRGIVFAFVLPWQDE